MSKLISEMRKLFEFEVVKQLDSGLEYLFFTQLLSGHYMLKDYYINLGMNEESYDRVIFLYREFKRKCEDYKALSLHERNEISEKFYRPYNLRRPKKSDWYLTKQGQIKFYKKGCRKEKTDDTTRS